MPNLFLPPAPRGKRAVWWCLFFFACSQVALAAYLHGRPELCDRVFGSRLRSLQSRLAQAPARPLVVVLGSSRAQNGLWPAALALRATAGAPEPLVYNFAISGSGSIRVLLHFRRLMAAGVRPEWLIVETWPPLWPEDGAFDERQNIRQDELRLSDLSVLRRYLPDERKLLARAVESSLTPILAHRTPLLFSAARPLLPREVGWKVANELKNWRPPDDTGWIPVLHEPHTPEEQRRELNHGLKILYPLVHELRIDPKSDGAMRELLDECRARGIKTVLLLMPEHRETLDWYTPESLALVRTYLGGLSREYQVPVVDTRLWVPDGDFADVCHMEKRAAAPYSERLGREVLQPLLDGRTLGRDVLLADEPR